MHQSSNHVTASRDNFCCIGFSVRIPNLYIYHPNPDFIHFTHKWNFQNPTQISFWYVRKITHKWKFHDPTHICWNLTHKWKFSKNLHIYSNFNVYILGMGALWTRRFYSWVILLDYRPTVVQVRWTDRENPFTEFYSVNKWKPIRRFSLGER